MKNFSPYYAVIFTSTQTEAIEGYSEMADNMETLAKQQVGITVSYWESLDAIKNWKQQTDHLITQKKGRQDWFNWCHVRICIVEREYEFFKP